MRHQVAREYPTVVETDVPMATRDGVILRADIVRPDAPGRFPVLLSRTPYGKNPNDMFARYGYVAIFQDCRGRFASEGDYYPFINDIADGYDAIEWAARLPWSNGRVGTFGQSYLAASQYMIACNHELPPHLQAMAPVSAASDFHEGWVYHTGGAMLWGWAVPYAILKGRNTLQRLGRQDLIEKLDAMGVDGTNFGRPLTSEWYSHLPLQDWAESLREAAPYFCDFLEHPTRDAYWRHISLLDHVDSISVPMLHISSWYDIFLHGALSAFTNIAQHGMPGAKSNQRLVIGPWGHLFPYVQSTSRGSGDMDFGPEALVDLAELQVRWFDYWLKDIETGIMDEPPVQIFVMGENRWRSFETWPPPNAHYVRYYLHCDGRANSLSGSGSLSTVPPQDEHPDTLTYDPNDPVPTLGGNNLTIALGVQDQRPVEERQDVLVFTSEAVERPLEVTGPIKVHLWAASSCVDTDFTAKLVDVHPDGYARNLQDGIIRARYRESAETPRLIEPGQVYEFVIDLWATGNVFQPGHRIRLEISSSNFPRFDRNQNTGAPFGSDARIEVAHQTVFHQTSFPSHVLLPIIPR